MQGLLIVLSRVLRHVLVFVCIGRVLPACEREKVLELLELSTVELCQCLPLVLMPRNIKLWSSIGLSPL